ncbi:larval cuticle protein LCP-22-like [Pieris napi]|uniref:larval cuticle protein LCP-22-like n=1 Tax=Pieris napi TaxID=78633 RepID=UPI001FBB9CC8|nr:larval cuticle protein LCP-22-like [Pieris napi]
MRFAVLIACVVAVASAQFNQGQYVPNDQSGQYKKFNQYNPFSNQFPGRSQYNQYNRYQPQPTYKPFVTSTPYPVRPVTVTEAPVAVSIGKFAPVPAPKPVQYPVVAVAKVAADARSAETVRYGNEVEADGSYNYFYETNNGIAAQAQGVPRTFAGNPPVSPAVAQGSFSWTSPEGEVISMTYVADENGYQPQGNAIPVAPEVPAQIARALAYIAKYAPVARE